MNISEAKAKLSELVRRAEAGEDVYLMRDGKVVASIKAPQKRGFQAGALNHIGLADPESFLMGAEPEDMRLSDDPHDGN
ncbi:MAG: type II toxin-antitoxin system prevent-host-death family antitoxin [Henriciella sp.]|nr:type II toxin-antitoxin system prevent-host-death family antitoxin [Henriciella sp.]